MKVQTLLGAVAAAAAAGTLATPFPKADVQKGETLVQQSK